MTTTQQLIQQTVGHLLPHPQILNFHDGTPQLPPGTPLNGLRLMMGAGDLNHGGIPNIQKFNTYDVFFCQPWDWNGSLLENVTYLVTQPNKLLCFIDIKNKEQVAAFTSLFANRFIFIDGHGGHCPHFEMSALRKLLQEGGTAANIYESSETCIFFRDMQTWLDKGVLPLFSANVVTSKIIDLTPQQEEPLKTQLCAKIRSMGNQSIAIQYDDLEHHSLQTLQHIARILLFELPLDLTGAYLEFKKDWQAHAYYEFVLTKRSPDFKPLIIADYIAQNGNDPISERATLLIQAIRADLDNDQLFGAQAKYATFCRHIRDKMQ